MTDEDVEKIIKRNMNLQMNLAGIRADFEEAQQRTWVGLTYEEVREVWSNFNSGLDTAMNFYNAIETKLKEKNI